MTNYLHIHLKEVENAQSDVDYLFHVIQTIYAFFPKGYIELPALCHYLYGSRDLMVLDWLRRARVEVEKPIQMDWTLEGLPILMNGILIPLAFVLRCYDKLTMVVYEKAYQRFLAMKEVDC